MEAFYVFFDLDKAFDQVPKKVIKWAQRKKLVQAVMLIYKSKNAGSVWRWRLGRIYVGVGVH